MARTHYDVLGASPNASPDALKRAWRGAVRASHPDHHPNDPTAHDRFLAVQGAWEVLSSPAHRAAYDRTLRRGPIPGAGSMVDEAMRAAQGAAARQAHDVYLREHEQRMAAIHAELAELRRQAYVRDQRELEHTVGQRGVWNRRGEPRIDLGAAGAYSRRKKRRR